MGLFDTTLANKIKNALAQDYEAAGDSKFDAEDYHGAIQEYTSALALIPYYSIIHYLLGLCYFKTGDFELAFDSFEQFNELESDDWRGYYQKGRVLAELEQFPNAIREYSNAIANQGHQAAEVFYHRSLAHAQQGDMEAAKQDYKQALQLKPELIARVEDL